MSSRIDVELTSKKEDGTWTWRAAGAKQPKGVVPNELLYSGAKIGDIVKVDAAFEMDGITVQAVIPPRSKDESANFIQLAPRGDPATFITSTLAKKREGRKGPRRDGNDRRPERADNSGTRPRSTSGPRPEQGQGDRRPRSESSQGDRRPRNVDSQAGPRRDQPRSVTPLAERPKFKRLVPLNKNRAAYLASVPDEHRAIAEQLNRGGMIAVRNAIREANKKANVDGTPETPERAVITIAESLLPGSQIAVWKDRAGAALKDGDEISLRDLRSVVASADSASKDPEARETAVQLKAKLAERTQKSLDQWLLDISKALDETRLVRALRLAARPPEPTAKFPQELSDRLVAVTNEAMAPETPDERWITLIDAVSDSPIRRQVQPAGFPPDASARLKEFAKESSGRIPALATMLGISVPPPPKMKPPVSGHYRSERSRRRPERTGGTPEEAKVEEAKETPEEA